MRMASPYKKLNTEVLFHDGFVHHVSSVSKTANGHLFRFCFSTADRCVDGSCFDKGQHNLYKKFADEKTFVTLQSRVGLDEEKRIVSLTSLSNKPPVVCDKEAPDTIICQNYPLKTLVFVSDESLKCKITIVAKIVQKRESDFSYSLKKSLDVYELTDDTSTGVMKIWEPRFDLLVGAIYEIRGTVKAFKNEVYLEVFFIFYTWNEV